MTCPAVKSSDPQTAASRDSHPSPHLSLISFSFLFHIIRLLLLASHKTTLADSTSLSQVLYKTDRFAFFAPQWEANVSLTRLLGRVNKTGSIWERRAKQLLVGGHRKACPVWSPALSQSLILSINQRAHTCRQHPFSHLARDNGVVNKRECFSPPLLFLLSLLFLRLPCFIMFSLGFSACPSRFQVTVINVPSRLPLRRKSTER